MSRPPFFVLSTIDNNGEPRKANSGAGDEARVAPASERWLSWYAKLVVFATFVLIFRGGLVTTAGAGMAVPDWPLSFNSLNPEGWWNDVGILLEHSHRLLAMGVGLLTAVLCTWIWRGWWALAAAVVVSAVLPPLAATLGASRPVIMHLAIWPAAAVFVIVLLARRRALRDSGYDWSNTVRWLGIAAFIGVCVQATFGGLRVTEQTAGDHASATILRIVHGCFAQLFLCVNVAIATLVSPAWREVKRSSAVENAPRRLAWIVVVAVFVQLIFGATMRHLGAGLAIPTFPQASPTGGWMPVVHNAFVDINFTHTRFGAVLVTALVLALSWRTLRSAPGLGRLTRPAWGLLALVAIQFSLGVLVIWHTRPPTITTLHVVNGAILLATGLLLTLRLNAAGRAESDSTMKSISGNSEEAAL